MSISDPKGPPPQLIQRRRALALLSLGGIAVAHSSTAAIGNEPPSDESVSGDSASSDVQTSVRLYATVAELRQDATLRVNMLARTLGYHSAGDGGEAAYAIGMAVAEQPADGGASIALDSKLSADLRAQLLPGASVNYRMFGAKCDGTNDDGVQIKQAHQFASLHGLPIIQPTGEFWIIQTNEIPITTNVTWGNTIFHINEKYNRKREPRFVVSSQHSSHEIELDETAKQSLLAQLGPGVQAIPELAAYRNSLVSIADSGDKIGFRAGKRYKGQSWNREELFYVEEDGRILGDIAWNFRDYTSLTATPCDDNFLIIDGGGFYLSGDNPGEKYTGYYQNGFRIQRSRTKIQNQWVGLEPDKQDISMEPRSGFYNLSRVFNVTLENIRLIPWEQNRSDPARVLGAGTYGIGGSRMLNCTFRNLTAEGTRLHWGVFGTNLNKNFRIENCRLNRVDVHFHCWNLTIQDSVIGLRGISITGGGDLTIENTVQHGNTFVNFRSDFGAKWDGNIRLRNCKLVPVSDHTVTVLSSRPSRFDYGYPIGCGRTIDIDNFQVDFSRFPQSNVPIWLLAVANFSQAEDGSRHFFAHHFSARNVSVAGRQQGVRLVHIADPYHYDVGREGGYDGVQLSPNCLMTFENIQLEQIAASKPNDPQQAHFQIGSKASMAYQDNKALFPQVRIVNCPNLSVHLGGSALSLSVTDSTIDRCTATADGPLRGALDFQNCRFAPHVVDTAQTIYALESELGTQLANCTVHAPQIAGDSKPDQAHLLDFVQPNRRVRFYQTNTALGNDLLKYFSDEHIDLLPSFIEMLKSHHGLETEVVPGSE